MNKTSQYLKLLEKSNITPNFWISEEYFHKAQLKEIELPNCIVISDGEWTMFPPLSKDGGFLDQIMVPHKIWSDFLEWKPPIINLSPKFLDLEFIYSPKDFLKMEGGKWATFRKNCRKWPRRFGDGNLTYDWIHTYIQHHRSADLNDLLASWLEKKGEEKIEDDEVMMAYIFEGKMRKLLWDRKGKIYGMNIFDENFKFLNFRFCICRPEEFLSEYLRFLFYTDPIIQNKNKLVNDGGILGNPRLKAFKDKLNPCKVRSVFSWIF